MTDPLLILSAWISVPAFMAGAAFLRERHERRFPDCAVCVARRGRSDAQNVASDALRASL